MKPPNSLIMGLTVFVIGIGVVIVSTTKKSSTTTTPINAVGTNVNVAVTSNANTVSPQKSNVSPAQPEVLNTNVAIPTSAVVAPMAYFFNRITKKPFGIYITPKTSPIQSEKFSGYHAGADAETTSAEKDVDVPIYAIATGTVVFAGHVNGYGGVIIIKHVLGIEHILSLYGHVRIASFTVAVGSIVKPGVKIAVLGTGYSTETDGERKHLHFGIIKGNTIDYKGYVTAKSDLSSWVDPVMWFNRQGI